MEFEEHEVTSDQDLDNGDFDEEPEEGETSQKKVKKS